jgi:replicative DNA helicase
MESKKLTSHEEMIRKLKDPNEIQRILNKAQEVGEKRQAIEAKKEFIEESRINRQYEEEKLRAKNLASVKPISEYIGTGDVYDLFIGKAVQQIDTVNANRKPAMRDSIPFLDNEFKKQFHMLPGELISVGAYTGGGKTTCAINIATTYIEHGKLPVIISNEECQANISQKIACLLLQADPGLFVRYTLPTSVHASVALKAKQLLTDKQLMVLDHDITNGDTTKSEAIIDMLETLNNSAIVPSVVIIDYLQNIYTAGSTSNDNHYFQLGQFLSSLKNKINTLKFPVVVMCQLHSNDKKKGSSLDAKIIMGGAIQQYSTVMIEIEKWDPITYLAKYVIHKNRTYGKYDSIITRCDYGRIKVDQSNRTLSSVMDGVDDEDRI